MRTTVHENSLLAYYEGRHEDFNARTLMILGCLKKDGPGTDRDVQARLGFHERGAVQPRISDAIAAGLITEIGKRECKLTGKQVRIVDVAPDPRLSVRQEEFVLTGIR